MLDLSRSRVLHAVHKRKVTIGMGGLSAAEYQNCSSKQSQPSYIAEWPRLDRLRDCAKTIGTVCLTVPGK